MKTPPTRMGKKIRVALKQFYFYLYNAKRNSDFVSTRDAHKTDLMQSLSAVSFITYIVLILLV